MHHHHIRRVECPVHPINPKFSPDCTPDCWYRHLALDIIDRFWSHVLKTETCWLWQAAVSNSGYGKAGFQGQDWLAHRFAWTLVNGSIPDEIVIAHLCDTKLCVRPDHLTTATQRENILDMQSKGRRKSDKGAWNPNSKLSDSQVREIRDRVLRGELKTALAREFGVNRDTIRLVAAGKSWAHVV